LSDAGPNSALLELISGGHDAEIRHLGEALRGGHDWPERIMDAPNPSILGCIAKKLPIVAISRDFLAFQDDFATPEGKTRCWVTLLPLSAGGAWVDYVYGVVSVATEAVAGAEPAKKPATKPEPKPMVAAEVEETAAAEVEEPVEAEAPEVDQPEETAAEVEEPVEEIAEPEAAEVEEAVTETPEPEETIVEEPAPAVEELIEESAEPEPEEVVAEAPVEPEEIVAEAPEALAEEPAEEVAELEPDEPAGKAPGFSKLLDSLAGLAGFYGSSSIKVDPSLPPAAPAAEEPVEEAVKEPETEAPDAPEFEEPVAEAPVAEKAVEAQAKKGVSELLELAERVAAEAPATTPQPAPAPEGSLQSKLTQVRAKADEARMARLRAEASLYDGLSAAYDFAIDAEDAPEEYLRLVEAQGLKIQLRSPMKPVVKLAFDGMADDATIKQLEAVLAWALKEELPRGSLGEKLKAAGGIAPLLNGEAKAA
jgi:hypothetical protein